MEKEIRIKINGYSFQRIEDPREKNSSHIICEKETYTKLVQKITTMCPPLIGNLIRKAHDSFVIYDNNKLDFYNEDGEREERFIHPVIKIPYLNRYNYDVGLDPLLYLNEQSNHIKIQYSIDPLLDNIKHNRFDYYSSNSENYYLSRAIPCNTIIRDDGLLFYIGHGYGQIYLKYMSVYLNKTKEVTVLTKPVRMIRMYNLFTSCATKLDFDNVDKIIKLEKREEVKKYGKHKFHNL